MRWAALVSLLLVTLPAAGQRRGDSHAPVPAGSPDLSNNELLERRLAEAQAPQFLRRLISNPSLIDGRLRRQLQDNPAAAEVLRRVMDGDPAMLQLLDQLGAAHSAESLRDLARRYLDAAEAGRRSTNNSLSAEERSRLAGRAYAERIDDFLRDYRLAGVSDQLKNSGVFNDWIKTLTQIDPDRQSPFTANDLTRAVLRADDLLGSLREWLPKDLSMLQRLDFSPPESPLFTIPRLSFGTPAGSIGFPESGFTAAVYGVIGLMLLIAAWKWARHVWASRQPHDARAGLGPWPTDPLQVATREQLVAAFDYYAVFALGAAASSWHHRAVAAEAPGDRDAARRLADLYEQARYSPTTTGPWESSRDLFARLITAAS